MSRPDDPDGFRRHVELVPIPDGKTPPVPPPAPWWKPLIKWRREHLLTVAILGLPALAAMAYYGFIASDRYNSQAMFVVRNFNQSNATALNSIIQTTGVARPADEAQAVNAFLLSRDAMRMLEEQVNLRETLGHSDIDLLWRFPGLTPWRTDDEALYQSYLDLLDVHYDTSTGITSLTVEAFRPDDAVKMAQVLLDGSEKLVNRLNERARTDMIRSAEEEARASKERSTQARQKLTDFRDREAVIDPTKVSQSVLETVGKLAYDLAQTQAQLAQLQRSSPQSPQINALRNRISALDAQIARERTQFGGSAKALAPRIAEYERLILEREFADQVLASALHSLEIARLDAQRQELYLERIVQPTATDYPAAPKRMLMILLILGLAVGTYTIIRTVINNARAHTQL